MPAHISVETAGNTAERQAFVYPGEALRLDAPGLAQSIARTVIIQCQPSDSKTEVFKFERPDDGFDETKDFSNDVLENCTPDNLKATLPHGKTVTITIKQDNEKTQVVTVDHWLTMSPN